MLETALVIPSRPRSAKRWAESSVAKEDATLELHDSTFCALTDSLDEKDNVSAGWAHVTRGVPDGQHHYDRLRMDSHANMFSLLYKHKLDKHLTSYLETALTIKHCNAHHDLVGRRARLVIRPSRRRPRDNIDSSGAGPIRGDAD